MPLIFCNKEKTGHEVSLEWRVFRLLRDGPHCRAGGDLLIESTEFTLPWWVDFWGVAVPIGKRSPLPNIVHPFRVSLCHADRCDIRSNGFRLRPQVKLVAAPVVGQRPASIQFRLGRNEVINVDDIAAHTGNTAKRTS